MSVEQMAAGAGLPDLTRLTAGLSAVLAAHDPAMAGVTVIERRPNVYESSAPTEVVRCRLGDGTLRDLFCKYATRHDHTAHGHRGGVAYEAAVYRHTLAPMNVSAPRCYGSFEDAGAGDICLVLDYLPDVVRLMHTIDPHAVLRLAARWIGRFHALNERRLAGASMPHLHRYDAAYYLGWAGRTLEYAEPCHARYPWLRPLCARFEAVAEMLLAAPATVIHGEFYPKNVLFAAGVVYPVDWESAAVAAGAIDLATLTEGWEDDTVRACADEYRRARWAQQSPAGFTRTLDAARLYIATRWLGERPESTADDGARWYIEQMHGPAKRLGLI